MEIYYQPEIECAGQEALRKLQNEKLIHQVRHVWENVPYYRKKMQDAGVTPDDIHSTADLYKLPFPSTLGLAITINSRWLCFS